jgi:hypothetical protein
MEIHCSLMPHLALVQCLSISYVSPCKIAHCLTDTHMCMVKQFYVCLVVGLDFVVVRIFYHVARLPLPTVRRNVIVKASVHTSRLFFMACGNENVFIANALFYFHSPHQSHWPPGQGKVIPRNSSVWGPVFTPQPAKGLPWRGCFHCRQVNYG